MGKIAEDDGERCLQGTILFSSVGRTRYAFDVFATHLPIDVLEDPGVPLPKLKEEKLTDGKSVNSNGHLVEGSAKEEVLEYLKKSETSGVLDGISADDIEVLAYVSEREGSLGIFVNVLLDYTGTPEALFKRWGGLSTASEHSGVKILTVTSLFGPGGPHLQDRPQVGGGRIVFVSTEQVQDTLRQSWTAVYSLSLASQEVIRLTPEGVSDYSPAISPSGKWVIAASFQGRGWQGEIHELNTDLYIFDAADGSQRRLVTKNGGWPSWLDESTFFFHRQAKDGWWSVFKVSLPEYFSGNGDNIVECRVTPPGVHAFTPSASRTGKWIALATRRPGSNIRHVEIFDLRSRTFIKVTQSISPNKNHYNPFVSSSSNKIMYHRCRGSDDGSIIPRLEPIQSAVPGLSLLRLDGYFPSFSHDGSLIAYLTSHLDGLMVCKMNGEGQRRVFSGISFGTAWDWKRKDLIYIASGVPFSAESAEVHIMSIFDAGGAETSDGASKYKQLTKNGTGNNAFPAPSPDGKYVVFRSGRNGHKNLYIMDAVDGEEAEIRQLTNGPWTDTMPAWSSTGEWIAFSSNRESTDEGHFAGYLIHPDGTGLHKILSDGGRVNHLYFSPDAKSLVFTADFAAVSAEPISVPQQFQPYGEIFISKIDGTAVQRLTHNAYEDGTPTWGPIFINHADLSPERGDPVDCEFDDVTWLPKGEQGTQMAPTDWCPSIRKEN